MWRRLACVTVACSALCLVPLGACGGDDDDDNNDSHTTTSGTYFCCLNGEYFACPSSAAVSTCSITTGAPDCSRDPSKDSQCTM